MVRTTYVWIGACIALSACGSGAPLAPDALTSAVDCAPSLPPLRLTGEVDQSDLKRYQLLPFQVGAGTGRIEVAYGWSDRPGLPSTPLTETTLDLGLYDPRGPEDPSGFRGWGGSRQGRRAR